MATTSATIGTSALSSMADAIAKQAASAKPASKPAKPAAKQASKQASKPASKQAAKPQGKPASKTQGKPAALAFYVRTSFRPSSGQLLFAYTRAWLEVSGLNDGASIPRADALAVAGSTAITHHVKTTGRMVDKGGSISLADGARAFFNDNPQRRADDKAVEAFKAVLTTGKPDGVYIKAAAGIGAIGKA